MDSDLESLKSRCEKILCMLIVKAKIRDVAGELSVASDFADALNQKVEQLVQDACKRAAANSRRTVMAKDL